MSDMYITFLGFFTLYTIFSDMCTTFFFWLLSLEQALSTLSTRISRYTNTIFVPGLSIFWSPALIYLAYRTFISLFSVALFGAGSIYPIYHVFWTCVHFLGGCSIWSRLYLPYLPGFQDMPILFLCQDS